MPYSKDVYGENQEASGQLDEPLLENEDSALLRRGKGFRPLYLHGSLISLYSIVFLLMVLFNRPSAICNQPDQTPITESHSSRKCEAFDRLASVSQVHDIWTLRNPLGFKKPLGTKAKSSQCLAAKASFGNDASSPRTSKITILPEIHDHRSIKRGMTFSKVGDHTPPIPPQISSNQKKWEFLR